MVSSTPPVLQKGRVESRASVLWILQPVCVCVDMLHVGGLCIVVARQKKLKLPSTRVGAKFDRHGPSADNWLPSFGRVWSKNCRTHNQYVD